MDKLDEILIKGADTYVQLGSCRKPHGIKGGFSLFLFNNEDSVLKKGAKVLLVPESSQSSIEKSGLIQKVKSVSIARKSILYFEGVDDRNVVEDMTPFALYVNRNDFPQEKDGEIYLSDLLNIDVFTVSGEEVGKVVRISSNGAQDILHINGQEKIDLLFIDQFVLDVDMDARKMIINKPEFE